jgi:hypothetical protein
MVWYGAPPTPWTAIVATRWWWLDRAPAEHAQTESVPSALVHRWVSFPQGQAPAVAELRACAISLCLTTYVYEVQLTIVFRSWAVLARRGDASQLSYTNYSTNTVDIADAAYGRTATATSDIGTRRKYQV